MKYTCAWCGEKHELVDTPWINGIKQPRPCKECLIETMQNKTYTYKKSFYFMQLKETGEIDKILKEAGNDKKTGD